ncbi:MAG TPA: hypothetical protein VF163_16260 [Micromonosporaceae bacterium]
MTDLAQAVAWHRQVAALVEAADRVGVGEAILPGVRERLRHQQARFAELAARHGSPLPPLVATPAEIASAAPALGDLSDAAVTAAFRSIAATLDAADAVLAQSASPVPAPPAPALAGPPDGSPAGSPASAGPAAPAGHLVGSMPHPVADPPPSTLARWPVAVRNGLVYAGFATAVLLVQLASLVLLDEERALPMLAPVCLIVLPAFAWAAGWLTIGFVFRPPRGAAPPAGAATTPGAAATPMGPAALSSTGRSPRLGAVICLLPNLLLCAGVVVLFIAR